jgi:hypothetical protein
MKIDFLDLTKMNPTTGNPTGEDLARYLNKFPNLKIIVLDGNSFLKSIPSHTFSGMRKLKVVSMVDIGLSVLPNGLFSMNPQLKCVILEGSAMEAIGKKVFRDGVANRLKEVNLKGSQMSKKSKLNDHFKGKKNIAKFLSRLP